MNSSPNDRSLRIVVAEQERHFAQLRELIVEYVAWDKAQTAAWGLDAAALEGFQYAHVEQEGLPTSAHFITWLLAERGSEAAGCVGVRKLAPGVCELKRLYVAAEFRRSGAGGMLLDSAIDHARKRGFAMMRLETAQFMVGALRLYAAAGFCACQPYRKIPAAFWPITVFMELNLRTAK